ncbi:YdeI/OmpD-associated family protein [Actinomycetospora chlora]|uniref:YdeI/OmpD-associated family protein n=1 Tax=Actinomycetospora chlora TaxID=663608 RepID=A0ABP9B2F2_9PSEU
MEDDRDEVHVASAEQWRAWLLDHHASSPGIWLVTWKKGSGPYVAYDDVVDQALCFGWVDSRPGSLDADRSRRLLTPRRPGSSWSRVNKERVERLTAAGRMAPAGLAAVAAAQADGSWTALDAVETLAEPDDLAAALDAEPAARGQWDGFPRSTRRAILEWISTAKTAPTRERRIAQTVAEAAVGRRANQWRQPGT